MRFSTRPVNFFYNITFFIKTLLEMLLNVGNIRILPAPALPPIWSSNSQTSTRFFFFSLQSFSDFRGATDGIMDGLMSFIMADRLKCGVFPPSRPLFFYNITVTLWWHMLRSNIRDLSFLENLLMALCVGLHITCLNGWVVFLGRLQINYLKKCRHVYIYKVSVTFLYLALAQTQTWND